ncbi:MAG: DUF3667 domain-containing protein [Lentimicrobiaceae bacterium]|nr:DUF3667 domain-containing protein [Lentimicrobiaceae bacterium]
MKWFKKKERALPEDTVCRNCGAQTVGRYCHECGQDLSAGVGQPILKLITQVLDNAFALEGKTPRSLAFLLLRPGFLSNEYRKGKIIRYVHPVKLFWMSTLIFFALVISQMDLALSQNGNVTPNALMNIQISPDETSTDSLSDNSINNKDEGMTNEKFFEFMRSSMKYFTKFAPYAAFLLMPIFALLLAFFFRRQKLFYMFHLVFAVHFHTFLWIYCSILLVIAIFTSNFNFPDWLSFLLFLVPGVYLSIGFHRFYHTKTRWQAVRKAIGIGILYFLLILIATFLLIAVAYVNYFPGTGNS